MSRKRRDRRDQQAREFFDWRSVVRFDPAKVIVETVLTYLVRINREIAGK